MYATVNGTNYPCSDCRHSARSVRFYLEVEPPDVISGEIGLYRDDGFKLASYDTHDFLRTYNVGNTVVLDNDPPPATEEPSVEEQIFGLKAVLEATDYKIIKSYEYQLVGLELPYDVTAIHAERQAIRDQINALEEAAQL